MKSIEFPVRPPVCFEPGIATGLRTSVAKSFVAVYTRRDGDFDPRTGTGWVESNIGEGRRFHLIKKNLTARFF